VEIFIKKGHFLEGGNGLYFFACSAKKEEEGKHGGKTNNNVWGRMLFKLSI